MTGIIEWTCKDLAHFGADAQCEGPDKGQYEGYPCDCYEGGWKSPCQGDCPANGQYGDADDCDCRLVCDEPTDYEIDCEDWDSRSEPIEGWSGNGQWHIADSRSQVYGKLCCTCTKALLEHMEQYRSPGETDAELIRLAFQFEWNRRQAADRNAKLEERKAILARMRRDAGIPDREPEPEGDCTRCGRGVMRFAGVSQYQQPHGEWFVTRIYECPVCGLAVDRTSIPIPGGVQAESDAGGAR